jgi:hypothetical protein
MHRSAIRLGLPFGFAVAALLVFTSGCGKTKKRGLNLDLTPVAGKVTLDGKPLAGADVAVYLTGERPQGYYGSSATTDAEGKFELKTNGTDKGAVPGSYKVTVSHLTNADGSSVVVQEGVDLEQLKLQGQVKENIPPKYSDMNQTELGFSVEKGKADGYNLELKSS